MCKKLEGGRKSLNVINIIQCSCYSAEWSSGTSIPHSGTMYLRIISWVKVHLPFPLLYSEPAKGHNVLGFFFCLFVFYFIIYLFFVPVDIQHNFRLEDDNKYLILSQNFGHGHGLTLTVFIAFYFFHRACIIIAHKIFSFLYCNLDITSEMHCRIKLWWNWSQSKETWTP